MGVTALIPAAGAGRRMGQTTGKLFMTLNGKPILVLTLEVFQRHPDVSSIAMAVPPGEADRFIELVNEFRIDKVTKILPGGRERQDSVYNLLKGIEPPDIVAIHDGARPLLSKSDLSRILKIPDGYDGAVLGTPLKDTIKQVGSGEVILGTPRRDDFWLAQTPQVFHFEILLRSYERVIKENIKVTDDSAIIEHCGGKVKLMAAGQENLKITTRGDIAIAEALLKQRELE